MADDAFVSRDGGAFVGRFEAEMRRIDGVDFRFYEAIWRGRERDRVGYDKKDPQHGKRLKKIDYARGRRGGMIIKMIMPIQKLSAMAMTTCQGIGDNSDFNLSRERNNSENVELYSVFFDNSE